LPAKRLYTRIQRSAALDSRLWKEFTDGAVAVLMAFPHHCDGCGREIGAGCVACRVVENKSLDVNYLCHDCYDKFKAGNRRERRMGGHVYTKER